MALTAALARNAAQQLLRTGGPAVSVAGTNHQGHTWACLFFNQHHGCGHHHNHAAALTATAAPAPAPAPAAARAAAAAAAVSKSPRRGYSTKVRSYSSPARQEVAADWESNVRHGEGYLAGPRDDTWWTGPAPVAGSPGIGSDGRIHSIACPNLATCTREELRAFFDNTWLITEVLFAGLQSEEPFYRPPYHHLRHPLIFYYGHPATLYVNKLRVAGVLKEPINPYYESIFETGVDEMKWDDMSKNDMIWPSVEEVAGYRREVYETVVEAIMTHPDYTTLAEGLQDSPFWSIVLGCDHERIHIETSSVLFRELPINLVRRPEWWPEDAPHRYSAARPSLNPVAGVDYPVNAMLPVGAGEARIGKPRDFPSFGWDNEYGAKSMRVKPFHAAQYLVSNGEFYEFVKSDGYASEEHWTPEGWQWRTFRNIRHPTFWVRDGPAGLHQYKLRNVFDEIDMPWSWAADVNYHEAKAFANWKAARSGKETRIITEAEHHLIRPATAGDAPAKRDPAMAAGGEAFRDDVGANLNLAYGSESAVHQFAPNDKGFHDAQGNVWHWCEDHLSALPGFKIHHVYEDFSIPCFDGEHQLILGGSFASTGDEASVFARFHFRPHFFQHAGVRLVEANPDDPTLVTSCMDNQGPYVGSNPFRRSSDAAATAAKEGEAEQLQKYLHLHFGGDNYPAYVDQAMLDFPARAARLVARFCEPGQRQRALDIGCAVGGSTFELARHFDAAVGLDINEAFITAAKELQAAGTLPYAIRSEGDAFLQAQAKAAPVSGALTFEQADATCIAPDIGQFDAVLIANVIDRITTPKSCLGRLGGDFGLVKPGGILVITSPFAWKEAFTPRELWIGGREDHTSIDELKAYMAPHWDLLHQEEMPLVIQDAGRTYELHYPLATVWKHKAQ